MVDRSKHQRIATTGFTLVELLVVIVIIAILVSLLLPAVQSAREAARRIQCQNHLKQIGMAVRNYDTKYQYFPPGKIVVGTNNSPQLDRGNWAIAILPYLEQQALYDAYNPKLHNIHPDNLPVLKTLLPVMTCPSDEQTDELQAPTQIDVEGGIAPGSYKGVSGKRWGATNGFFDYPPFAGNANRTANRRGPLHMIGAGKFGAVRLGNIRDGTTNTLLVGEYHTAPSQADHANGRPFWASSHSFHNLGCPQLESYTRLADYDRCMEITGNMWWQCDRSFASLHFDGQIQFVLCDGSVQTINPYIDGEIFEALATVAGGEDVTLP